MARRARSAAESPRGATGTAAADPVVPVAPPLPTRHAAPSPAGRPLTADERAALYGEFLAWRLRQVPR
ncbi:hypothetical protein [Rhodoplanes serenus]|uniref:hypothetical protein n=1 Tax=Rhodoplanes serenus TaxID=200615 RepID=UPI000DAB6271|nr:hypothetical protein [Rhodoplanes serenus]RAI32530.1 hypothetical protein CH340_15185 [Rhodoplanes serenus]